jgi:hypothetical protein
VVAAAGLRIAFCPLEAAAAETDRIAAFGGPLIVRASEAVAPFLGPMAEVARLPIPMAEETASGAVLIGVMAPDLATPAAGADRTALAGEVTTTDADVAPRVVDGDKFIDCRSKNCRAGDMNM